MINKKTVVSVLSEIIQTALISLGIFFIVYIFIIQPHRVKGESMMPNFSDGELLLTEKVSYRFQNPKRGDVIVFQAPTPRKADFIKRIIGLPGDTVNVNNGNIIINGAKLNEPFETQSTDGNLTLKLSKDEYFVLGDNRNASSDSRSFGPIDKKTIRGRAFLVYWPIYKTTYSKGARFISRIDYSLSNSF